MAPLAILEELPAGYVVDRGEVGVLAVTEDLHAAFRAAGFGPDGGERVPPSDLIGRRRLRQLDVGGRRYVVRPFRHGGLLAGLTGARYVDPARPFRELVLADRLIGLGLPTPRVVAARARRADGLGWYLDVVTERIEEALDLGQLLAAVGRGEVERGRLAPVLRTAGRLVRSLHDAGLRHADLNARNLLVERAALRGAPPSTWVLDLDRSELGPPLDEGERRASLRRLYRSAERLRGPDGGAVLTRADAARFLLAYVDADPWKPRWRRIAREHARWRAWHVAGRLLQRRTRPTEPPPLVGAASGEKG